MSAPPDHPYAGQRAALATMHRKEEAIAPPLRDAVGLRVVAPPGLDTDALGTFTGEVPRVGTMGEVAERKARLGMARAGLPLGLASEGTFGPHPTLAFVPAGLELLVFVDDARGLVVRESLVAEETNFDHLVAAPGEPLGPFLARVRFPSHALVVRANAGDGPVAKGIVDRAALERAVAGAAARSADGRALVETDMRAHLNPTRMRTIRTLAERLGARLAVRCPACGAPGYGRVGVVAGLPCEGCGTPTAMAAAERFGCAGCEYAEDRPRPDGRRLAPMASCPACNP